MSCIGSRPWWVTLLVAVTMMTATFTPLMMELLPPSMGTLILFYPLYAIVAPAIAWKLFPERRELFWTLMLLAWLTFAGMWLGC